MKITLIYPSQRKANPDLLWKHPKHHKYPGLGLLIVASLCPSFADIEIIDDDYDLIDYSENTDIVGISALTMNVNRAYQIATIYREKNVPVVLGGFHVSACPDEALKFADAIVIGEAEDTWPQLLQDLNTGSIKKIYRSKNNTNLAGRPRLDRDLLKAERYYTINTVEASRGCPQKCEFCSMASLLGNKTRVRPIEEVVDEIKSFKGKYFVLNDDNIAQKFDYYKDLLRRLIPLKKRWAGQASWNIVSDEELLDLISRSGCAALHIGFDSFHTQEGVKKIPTGDKYRIYEEAVKTFHSYKICVFGAFLFGFDTDQKSIFEKTLNFAINSRMEIAQFNILTPYPGTKLYHRLKNENRITEDNWNNYITGHLCFKLKNMSCKFFMEKYYWLKSQFYSYNKIASRLFNAMRRISPMEFGLLLGINLGFRKKTSTYKIN